MGENKSLYGAKYGLDTQYMSLNNGKKFNDNMKKILAYLGEKYK